MEACKYGSLFRRGHPEDPVQGRYIIFDETGSFRFSEGEGYFHFEMDFTSGMEIRIGKYIMPVRIVREE